MPVGRPKLRYKDACKNAQKFGDALEQWKTKRIELNGGRHMICQKCDKVNEKRVNAYEKQREKRRRKENLQQ